MKKITLLSFICAVLLLSCAKESPKEPTIVGNDRDKNGCIGSAGYIWCEKTAQCERPWELAKKENFELTDSSFNQFCHKPR